MLGRKQHTEPAPIVSSVRYSYQKASLGGWRIVDNTITVVVEVVGREAVAASHTAHLNAGEARIEKHNLIGTRVVMI